MLSNPRSDRVRAVARLSGRSARERAGRFLVEGPQAVREAVGGATVRELYATEDAAARYPEIMTAAEAVVQPRLVTDEVLATMVAGTGTATPQGLLAVCDLVTADLGDVVANLRPRPLVAVLSRVRDPGNAGTVIRVADAAGADAVILTDESVDVHNPKTVRATAGSLFHLPVVTGVPLAEAVAALRGAGLTLLAADGAGDTDLDDLEDAALEATTPTRQVTTAGGADPAARQVTTAVAADPAAQDRARGGRTAGGAVTSSLIGGVGWIFGNEAWGLPEEDRALADLVVRVPIHGRAESLNLAAAAAVCLYATARAHRAKRPRRV